MCGLFGWQLDAARVTDGERLALAVALVSLNDERGGDAWGYWTSDHEINPVRGLGTMRTSVSAAALAAFTTLCGHTRYATQGEADKVENAHPFEHRDVIGAHNGAVYNAFALDHKYPERDFDVDSMHLIAHIAERKPLAELTGYGTVVYTSRRKPGRVYLGRFCDGELAIARLGVDGQPSRGLVWSSDRSHLYAALRLAGVSNFTTLRVKPHRWHYADGGRLVNTGTKIPIGERPPLPSKTIPSPSGLTQSAATDSSYADVYDTRTGKWTRTYRSGWYRDATSGRALSSALRDGFDTLGADGDDAADDAMDDEDDGNDMPPSTAMGED